jgi:ABC-type lipoprotein release transport system permease subunit
MTFTRLLLRNLAFHWRANVAVLLGVAVGTAVLTGALVMGDSLRGSLRERALEQLGWVDQALVAPRFFREMLAEGLPAQKVSPAILVRGSASAPEANAGQVTILAVDDRFWPADQMPVDAKFWRGQDDGVVLNADLARRLGVKAGDRVSLFLQSGDNLPRESLLGKRKSEDVLSRFDVTVRAVLPESGLGRFTLRPGPAPPLNAYVPLRLIQDRYDPEKRKAPLAGRVNALFVSGVDGSLATGVALNLTLDDWGLTLRTPADRARDWFQLLLGHGDAPIPAGDVLRQFRWKGRVPPALAARPDGKTTRVVSDFVAYVTADHGYLSLESNQLFVEPAVVTAAEKTAAQLGWRAAPTLVYLVDTLSDGQHETPYAVVAALDPTAQPPLGPFNKGPLVDNQIVVARWPGSPLEFAPKQAVTLKYYLPDDAAQLELAQTKLEFAGWVDLTGAADDADLTPRFEGITDKLDLLQWENPPFPFDRRRLQGDPTAYWERYRTTPKAYVNLATGQKLWGSRFGQVTSVRLAPGKEAQFGRDAAEFSRRLLQALPPEQGGFAFDDARARAVQAGQGSTDFGLYFLGFSSFLIAAALMLVGLLVQLSIDRRASELGLLLAVGWERDAVRRLVLLEGLALALVGGLLGVGGAVLYAASLLDLLAALWPGGLERSLLWLHVEPLSCVIGYGASVAVALVTIFLATRALAKVPPRALLAGETTTAAGGFAGTPLLSRRIAAGALVAALACLAVGAFANDHEAKAGSFFGSGLFLLTALLAMLWWWMRRAAHGHGRAMPGLLRLGVRNAARHPVRSVLTVGLLASACFLIVAVQAFHRDAGRDFLEKTGGSGGFALVGEATVPIFQDLNTPAGRAELGLAADLGARFVPLRVQPGDDASCLNLYQPGQPRIVGVPQSLIDRGGFQLTGGGWDALNATTDDGCIPAIGEANTVTYILHKGIGDDLEIKDGQGRTRKLRIVGLLHDSVFQSELLIADARFKELFPRQEGFRLFLIEAPPANVAATRKGLETALAGYGFSATPSAERLQAYLDVENTYLATFQALGGLGLLLGTLGLAIVLVRSVWERRGELALLRALGFRRSALGVLVLAENVWLLVVGLAFGCAAALAAVAPFVAAQAGEIVQPQLFALLAAVLLVGLACGALAVATTLRTPLLPALRRE